jgi:hypothetical protein
MFKAARHAVWMVALVCLAPSSRSALPERVQQKNVKAMSASSRQEPTKKISVKMTIPTVDQVVRTAIHLRIMQLPVHAVPTVPVRLQPAKQGIISITMRAKLIVQQTAVSMINDAMSQMPQIHVLVENVLLYATLIIMCMTMHVKRIV